jgi:hypothetical protein
MFSSVAMKSQYSRAQDSQSISIPAPTGGVNARDAIANMPPTDCIIADNWFGTPSYIQIRNGARSWATGLPGAVETIMAYNGLTSRKLFAASVAAIYDVTSTGAVGAAAVSGTVNARWQHAMFNAGGGNVLVIANGATTPRVYDGASWANSTVSGVGLTASNLITVTVFKQRVWHIENNTMNVWYSATSAFQGVFTKLPLGQLFKKGGTLIQMATWTIDNVSGMDDYAAFITSEGEVAIYQGYDPSTVSTWSLVGIFNIGRPIGIRCIARYASDVLVITADGVTPLSKALLTDRTQSAAQLTDKIVNAIGDDITLYGSVFGWQVVEHPAGAKLIVNVPELANVRAHQWVMNTNAMSWWRFKSWNANCFEVQQDALYYGGNTIVYLADTGTSDPGTTTIVSDCKPAFSYFDTPGQIKLFAMARPVMRTNTPITPIVTLNIDFNDSINLAPPITIAFGSPWDTSAWDVTSWGAGTDISYTSNKYQGVVGIGYAASGRISMQTSGVIAQWYSTDYIYKPGGPL